MINVNRHEATRTRTHTAFDSKTRLFRRAFSTDSVTCKRFSTVAAHGRVGRGASENKKNRPGQVHVSENAAEGVFFFGGGEGARVIGERLVVRTRVPPSVGANPRGAEGALSTPGTRISTQIHNNERVNVFIVTIFVVAYRRTKRVSAMKIGHAR